jgi:hypothetical protein
MVINRSASRVICISLGAPSRDGNSSPVLRDGWGLPTEPGETLSRQKQNNNFSENEDHGEAA